MLQKKIYFSAFMLSIIFLFSFTMDVDARMPSVIDCMQNNAGCEENGEDHTQIKEPEKEQIDQPHENDTSESLPFVIIKTFVALILVLALIYLLIKLLSKRNKLFQQVKALENLGGISVGQNKSIQIVRVGTQVFLVGVGDNVEMLQEVTDEHVLQDLLHKDEHDGITPHLGQWLPSLQSKPNGKRSTSDFKLSFFRELDKLKETRKVVMNQHTQKEDEHE
jgi:flagellar protein FliO/FliZ